MTVSAFPGAYVVEGALALLIFLTGTITGHVFLAQSGARTLMEWESAPAAMIACGAGFRQPASEGPSLVAFEMRQRPAITCAEVIGDGASTPPMAVTLGERYAVYGAALALQLAGLSWQALDLYLAVLFGLSMALAYGIFRLFAGRAAAIFGVAALCFSGHLLGLQTLRDYGKEPGFYAVWLGLGWLLGAAREVDRRTLVPAAVLGGVTGVGLGFRTDILVAVPACVAVIVMGLRGFRRYALAWKAASAAVYLVMFVVTGWPILSAISAGGSNTSHVIIMGLFTPFNESLGLEPAPYDVGSTYSDGYGVTLVTAHASLVQGEPQPVGYATTRYDRLGAALLGGLARQFPADVVTRTAGAIAQILRYPFDARYRAADLDRPAFAAVPLVRRAAEGFGQLLNAVEGHALWLTALVLAGMLLQDRRRALIFGLLLTYFCGYSMLQFSRRHTFHLDIVAMIVVVVCVDTVVRVLTRLGAGERPAQARPARALSWRERARHAVVAVAVIVAGGGGLILATRWWQQREVGALLERTLATRWETLQATSEPLGDTTEPAYYLYPELWRTGVLMRVTPPAGDPSVQDGRDRLETSYLLAEIGGPGCTQSPVHLATAYAGSEHTAHREYSRTFEVPTTSAAPTKVLVPAFYQRGPYWTRFDGFATPAAQASCLGTLSRAVNIEDVPLPILTAVLPPDWRVRPLYQRLAAVDDAR